MLGAGLGERLRPLTEQLPKPLIPVFNRPLITHAFDHLRQAGVDSFVINTHHLPRCYAEAFPDARYAGAPLAFRHEPLRLETAGGLANVRDLLDGDASFFVYNGDILTDMPLGPLRAEHERAGNVVTLALRSHGPALHIAIDEGRNLVTDIRGILGTPNPGTHLFTGVYAVHPRFFDHLTPGKVESVIAIFLRLIEQGQRVGAVVLDEGTWLDLGSRDSYLAAHRDLTPAREARRLAASARIAPDSTIGRFTTIGPGAQIGSGAVLEDCILWPNAVVEPGSHLRRCIVRSGMRATGVHENRDF